MKCGHSILRSAALGVVVACADQESVGADECYDGVRCDEILEHVVPNTLTDFRPEVVMLLSTSRDLLDRRWSDDEGSGITAPTLITVGDCDAVRLEHAVRFLQLRGGDVNGDFVGVPASQLAVFPGTTHFFGLARTDLVRDVVLTFLDAPMRAACTPAPLRRHGRRVDRRAQPFTYES